MIDCVRFLASHYMGLFRTELTGALLITYLVLLTGCGQLGQYDITVNDVTVYEPPAPFKVDGIDDAALAACLQQTVTDLAANGAEEVITLNCSDAGIQSLSGLEQFTQIRTIKLSGNNIRNLLELERLPQLEQLLLDQNDVVDPIPVLRITGLRTLNLAGNVRLQCPDADDIPRVLTLTLPDHCDTP